MQFKIILPISLTLLLFACGEKAATNLDTEKFEAYLKVKRVPLNDETRYERMQQEYLRRQALASAIDETGELDDKLVEAEVEEFRKELLIGRYFDSYLKKNVSDESLQNYYRNNQDKFKSTRAGVSHILFRVNPRMTEAERQAKLTTAMDVHSKLILGEGFEDLAQRIKEGAVSRTFSEKVFALEEGEHTEPFLTEYGFHIAKLQSAPSDVIQPFEAKKGDIRYQLRNQSKQVETKRLLDSVGYKSSNEAN